MTFQERLGALIATIRKLSDSSYEQFASNFSEKIFGILPPKSCVRMAC